VATRCCTHMTRRGWHSVTAFGVADESAARDVCAAVATALMAVREADRHQAQSTAAVHAMQELESRCITAEDECQYVALCGF